MSRTTRVLLCTLLTLALVSCGDDDGGQVQTDPTSPSTSSTASPSTTEATTTTAAPSETSTPPPTSEEPIETGIVLADDGLVIVPFGADELNVLSSLEPDLGDPDASEEAECPSGADQILRYENLTLVLSGGFFVGYVYSSPAGGELGISLATDEGLVLSAPESELRTLYPDVTIEESSLGTEFFVETDRGYLGGLLSGPGGVVESIFAGDSCAFR
jgi:hypothetical protein